MSWHEFIADPRCLLAGNSGAGPLVLIDLDRAPALDLPVVLPPCPVIGFGDPAHPLAAELDGVVQAPVGLELLARQVTAQPLAAAVVVDLLRILPGLADQQALMAESLAYGLLQGSAGHARWLSTPRAGGSGPPGRLRVERQDYVLRLTLDRVAAGNAIDQALRDQLDEAFAVAALDTTITRILLAARGRAFCLGAELGEFGTTRDPATAHAIRRQSLPARQIARCANRLEVHVQGGCVGAGLEMAAWARRLTAAPGAWFQLPELAMGILPGAGGCVSLTRRIGRQQTALLVLSGKRLSASMALEWGLIDAIMDDPAADDRGADIGG